MTTPQVPYRMELVFELPGSPEQVWQAIATANGISSWMLPTDLEEREGGAVSFHMGEDLSSDGVVTGWEPPRRLVYEEPDWNALAGHPTDPVTPLVSEFLVEATSGGTCVLRVVTSGFGTGADWEREFFDDMAKHWAPSFENLRLYLTHFPGQQVTTMSAEADLPGGHDAVWAAMRAALGASEPGQPVELNGTAGVLERLNAPPGPREALVRLTGDVPGMLSLMAHEMGDGTTRAVVGGYIFSAEAASWVADAEPRWRAWLEQLAVPA